MGQIWATERTLIVKYLIGMPSSSLSSSSISVLLNHTIIQYGVHRYLVWLKPNQTASQGNDYLQALLQYYSNFEIELRESHITIT